MCNKFNASCCCCHVICWHKQHNAKRFSSRVFEKKLNISLMFLLLVLNPTRKFLSVQFFRIYWILFEVILRLTANIISFELKQTPRSQIKDWRNKFITHVDPPRQRRLNIFISPSSSIRAAVRLDCLRLKPIKLTVRYGVLNSFFLHR